MIVQAMNSNLKYGCRNCIYINIRPLQGCIEPYYQLSEVEHEHFDKL